MTIRSKLNLSILAVISLFLVAAGLNLWAVRENAEQTRQLARMREMSQFTADLRTAIYRQLAMRTHGPTTSSVASPADWSHAALDDIDIQLRLAADADEKALWTNVRRAVADLAVLSADPAAGSMSGPLRDAEHALRGLRDLYDLGQYQLIAKTARTSLVAQVAVAIACLLTVCVLLAYFAMLRRWLVRPIEVLRQSADAIGKGDLSHRVPLRGADELAQLARGLDSMAEGLARHQKALIEARELSTLGELCANVAHGLRNPLAALRAGAQLAERRAVQDPTLQATFRELARQADRLNERITGLFEFSRPLELRRRDTTFREVAQAVHAQALPLMQTRGITLRIEDDTQDAVCHVDDDHLARSLAELVGNAVHHSPEGSVVRLCGERLPAQNGTGERLRFQIVDQGAGMTAPTAQQACELFFTTRPDGTGLGLALVRRFVETCAGDMSIDSTPGRGTTVTITLPIRSTDERASA